MAGVAETSSLIDATPLTDIDSLPSSPSTPKFLPSTMTNKPTVVDATTRLALECKESPLFMGGISRSPGAPAFFANIRQNMDLYGGVGPLIPINAPKISASVQSQLPQWIRT